MKKLILASLLFLINSINAQPTATTDTIYLNGLNTVNLDLLSNDAGSKIYISSYTVNGFKYSTSTYTARTIYNFGRILVRSRGLGTFKPSSSYTAFAVTYTIKDSRNRIAVGKVIFKTQEVVIPPDPTPSDTNLIVSSATSQYTLSSTATTSAGVYKNGQLVRTLWNNVKRNAGTYTATWDGKDDTGATVVGTTQIKVQAHTMSYQWTANIGNSSSIDTGSHKLRGLSTPYSGVEVGDYIYIAKGTTEGNTPIYKVAKSNPNYMIEVRGENAAVDMHTDFACSDGTRVYWAGYDAWTGYWPISNTTPPDTNSRVHSIIYATNVSNDTDYIFSAGKTTKPSLNGQFSYSGLTILDDTAAHPTGLAVTTGATGFLYSTHKGLNQLRCYDKLSGALLRTNTLPLRAIAIDGNVLYGIVGDSIRKFTINASTGVLTYSASGSISVTKPINISAKNGVLMVIAGSTQQQVKAFNYTGTALWTLGQSGGYVNSPTVANDKFQFQEYTGKVSKGYLIPLADSSFWVGDAGNCRQIHFSKTRTFVESSFYLPTNYNASTITAEPTRIFAGLLEFDLTTRALVKNWSGNITSSYAYNTRIGGLLTHLITISGKTFGTIYYYPTAGTPDGRLREWVELGATGIRYTGIRLDDYFNYNIESNGDRYFYDGDFYAASGTGSIMKQAYTGLDGSSNPTWATATIYLTFPLGIGSPYYACSNYANSKGIIFAESRQNEGFHLGRVSGGQYLWQTSKSTTTSYTGDFPNDGTFDVGNNVNFAGKSLHVVDSLAVWNYVGEFWKNAQVNKWNMYHQDGLMLMQLGKTTPEARIYSNTNDAPREAAGNALESKMVKIGNDYYIIHCDESVHGAIHVFKILNANTIKIITLQ